MSEFDPKDLIPEGRYGKTDPILLKAMEENDDEAFERRMSELEQIAAEKKAEPTFGHFHRLLKALHLA